MSKLVFFRQGRVDGGIRTGIDIDGTTFDHFESGIGEHDPALAWFVDLRLEGNSVPAQPERARQWLLDHKSLVNEAYTAVSRRLQVGMDPDVWPLQCEAPNAPPGVHITTVCSSTATTTAREIGATILDIAQHWEDYLDQVPAVHAPLE